MDLDIDICMPKIEENEDSDKQPKDRLLDILDQVEAHVERLRKDTLTLEEKKDFLFTTLDTIRNSELLADLLETDKDDIQRYIERVTMRCMTIEILVRTERDPSQEDSLHQVNRLIDQLVVSFKVDPSGTRTKCQAYMAACSPQPEVPSDKFFETALLGCALDDQKKIKKRLQGLFNYLEQDEKMISVLMTLHEKGLKFNTQLVNIAKGEQYEPWYLAINPKGEVPVIKDEETIIVDSARIINYLEDRYTHGITEKAPGRLRKLAESHPEMRDILLQKAAKIETDLARMQGRDSYLAVLDRLSQVLDEIEHQLATNQEDGGGEKWLVTGSVTVADIGLTILLERLSVLGLEDRYLPSRPHLKTYFQRIQQRDSYKKTTPSTLFHLKSMIQGLTYVSLF